MKAIRVHQYGGAEVLRYEDVPKPEPGQGEVLVEIHTAGVNFIDTYYRTGLYKAPALPFTVGSEASGVVAAVGPGVTGLQVGDRVAYAMQLGAYAEYAIVPAWRLARLPAGIDFRSAAAIMLQGMTAHYLTQNTFNVKPGDVVLVHAGAGGVGLLLIQICRRIGATVFTTAGNPAKAGLARGAGAHEVIVYSAQDFEAEVKRITSGKGVDVVYDGVGAATFDKSLNCLKTRGYMVLYGQSSGAVPPVDPSILMVKGSIFLTRPTLGHYAASAEEIASRTADLFRWVVSG